MLLQLLTHLSRRGITIVVINSFSSFPVSLFFFSIGFFIDLTLSASTLQKGQTHSNNSSATADELSVFDLFDGLALKGLHC